MSAFNQLYKGKDIFAKLGFPNFKIKGHCHHRTLPTQTLITNDSVCFKMLRFLYQFLVIALSKAISSSNLKTFLKSSSKSRVSYLIERSSLRKYLVSGDVGWRCVKEYR